MSANRIVKRRAFAGSQAKRQDKPVTYHEYAISSGDRHPNFQRRVRAVRAEHGLQPTSGNMHRVHGRSV